MFQGQVNHNGRLAEIAVGEFSLFAYLAADQETATAIIHFLDESLVIFIGFFIHHGTQEGILFSRVANGELIGQFHHATDEFLVNRFFDKDARAGRALLSLQAKGRTHNPHCSFFDFCIAGNDGGVFTAKFQDGGFDIPALVEIAENLHAHIERTGESDTVHFGAIHQRLTQGAARTGDIVEYTSRQAGIPQAFRNFTRGPRGICSGFEDDGIACRQG